ncbi:glycosyltransferase 61 family protein [Alisedimentitalea sp. MJ-SS2]|uniref:glycosyltransferase family 61 protein n=1 Tax=Aliisedimentitalea sp. MJ-SS2 TaxID=3049795 RepID=UPI0029108D9F|nr:glycosyltransferase 61 family protein [Alisedimentitalea sp. MJ-SS2]MDU8927569.1 glycosyltransferase 61 family protein [Alisedimentitalea sp. MJ-SS2]
MIHSFDKIPAAHMVTVRDAITVPPVEGRNIPSGVFDDGGTIVDNSRTLMGGPRWSDIPPYPDPISVHSLPGRHLFGGVGRVHFGHFLIETIPRLWALDHLDPPVESVIFFPMHGRRTDMPFGRTLRELIDLFCGDVPITMIDHPTEIAELVVPSQGVGHLNWSTGTPEFRQFVRSRFEAAYKPDGPERLYISRTRLGNEDSLVDQEDAIEELMAAAGYTIFHPERYSIREQVEHLMAAKTVVGADGSAFHLAAHVLQPGTRVGLIKRRHRTAVFNAIAEQVKAFGEVDLSTIHPLKPQQEGEPKARLNMFRLERALRQKGFL